MLIEAGTLTQSEYKEDSKQMAQLAIVKSTWGGGQVAQGYALL